MPIEQVFVQLSNLGVVDILLPFLLVFAVTFGVLWKVKIFEQKKLNGVIALILALATIFPHALWGVKGCAINIGTAPRLSNGMIDVVCVINNSLPSVSVIVVAILMALIIIGVLGKRVELGDNSLSGWIAFLAFLVVIYIFGGSAGWWHTILQKRGGGGLSDDMIVLILVILVFAIIIWFVTKDDDHGDGHRMTDNQMGDKFAKLLKGGGHH